MKHITRFFGLFIISLGINLAILSNLDVSPVSAFTVPLSRAVGTSLDTVTAGATPPLCSLRLRCWAGVSD